MEYIAKSIDGYDQNLYNACGNCISVAENCMEEKACQEQTVGIMMNPEK